MFKTLNVFKFKCFYIIKNSECVAQLLKKSAFNAGHLGLIPGLGRSPGEGKGYPLQYSDLENFMDCIVHGVAKSWTQETFTFTECLFLLIKSILDITYVFATLIFLPSLIHTSLPKALLPGITVPLPVLLHLIVNFPENILLLQDPNQMSLP